MPAAQATQAEASALGALPARQGQQEVDALRPVTVPEGQALQALVGSWPEERYVPLRHLVHAVAPVARSVA